MEEVFHAACLYRKSMTHRHTHDRGWNNEMERRRGMWWVGENEKEACKRVRESFNIE